MFVTFNVGIFILPEPDTSTSKVEVINAVITFKLPEPETSKFEIEGIVMLIVIGSLFMQILFLCLSDISLFSKMDELFSSITSKSSNDKKSTLIAYKEDNFSFQQLWKKDFSSGVDIIKFKYEKNMNFFIFKQITCIYWDEALTFLAVGFEDGGCECIRVSTEHNYKDFDEVKKNYNYIFFFKL